MHYLQGALCKTTLVDHRMLEDAIYSRVVERSEVGFCVAKVAVKAVVKEDYLEDVTVMDVVVA